MPISLINIFIALMIPLLLIMVTMILSSKSINDREKSSPFECGFDPMNNARLPFSLRFFLLAVIFLVFDIEIALLLPLPLSINMSNLYLYSPSLIIFLLILTLGLLHEWNEGSLDWSY